LYRGQPVADFGALLQTFTDSELSQLSCSTIPFLVFWQHYPQRLTDCAAALGVNDLQAPDLEFEHETPSFTTFHPGNPPSQSDLMCRSPSTAIAVEAKSTENLSARVHSWLGPDPTMNRRAVLNHWLLKIVKRTGGLQLGRVPSLDYKQVHRTAALCQANRERLVLVYQFFQIRRLNRYTERHVVALQDLALALGAVGRIEIYAQIHNWQRTPDYHALAAQLAPITVQQQRAALIRQRLLQGTLFQVIAPPEWLRLA
jgi:hypothetical protein